MICRSHKVRPASTPNPYGCLFSVHYLVLSQTWPDILLISINSVAKSPTMDFKPDTFHKVLSSVCHSMHNVTKFLRCRWARAQYWTHTEYLAALTLTRSQKPFRAVIQPQHLALKASTFSNLSKKMILKIPKWLLTNSPLDLICQNWVFFLNIFWFSETYKFLCAGCIQIWTLLHKNSTCLHQRNSS